MYVSPRDSRQRYTKQCLFDAFSALMKQRPVSQITVTQICDDAQVSRMTFYKYYSDPFELLKSMQEDLFTGFMKELDDVPASIFEIMPVLVRFVQNHQDLIRVILENRGEGNFIDKTIAYLYDTYRGDWQKANPKMSKEDVDYLFYYVVSGLVGVIRHWLVETPETPVEKVIERASYLMQLTTPKK